MREHLDRVIKGEDTFKVSEELRHRYKMEQRKLKRTMPTQSINSNSNSNSVQSESLKR